jgi:hypothetical protein
MSGINEYLSKALNCSTSSESASNLAQAENLLEASSVQIPSILPVLQKILKTHEIRSYFPLLKFYNKLLDYFSKFNVADKIQMLKEVIFLTDKLKDCKMTVQVIEKCEKIIEKSDLDLSKNPEISGIFSFPASIDLKLQEIVENLKNGGILSLTQMFDMMSGLPSTYHQCKFIETRFEGFLLAVEKHLKREDILPIIKFIENFIFKKQTLLKINEKSQEFFNFHSKFNQKLSKVAFKVLDLLISFDVKVTQNILTVLSVLWEDDDIEKESIYDITKLLLSDIASNGDPEFLNAASALLHRISTSKAKSSFKYSLEHDKSLRPLFESDHFQPLPALPSSPESEIEKIASSVKIEVPAGQNFSYLAPVDKAGTLLVWGFICVHHDIAFKVTNLETGAVLVETRVKCEEIPFTGQVFVEVPGLFELTWVNSYSWLNSKQIKLRIQQFEVLPKTLPMKKSIIEVLNSSNNPSLIQIGVWKKTSSKENQFQVLSQGSTFFIDSLVDLYETLQMFPEGSKFSVGVVGASPLYVPKLQVDVLCTCQDSEALALMGFGVFGMNTVVAVVVDESVRVAVGCLKTLVHSGLARYGLAEEIGRILDVFGPAFVLVAGEEMDLRALEKEVENFVCVEVTQQSLFRNSNDLLIQAASRLFSFVGMIEGRRMSDG